MRTNGRALAPLLILLLAGAGEAFPASESVFMQFGKNALAPMEFVQFCERKPARCRPSNDLAVVAYYSRRQELDRVQVEVNWRITPRAALPNEPEIPWDDEATAGNCDEYVLAKRSRLLDIGFPSSTLLVAEGILPAGEAHLVLVVSTDRGDYVLDNLQPAVVRWDELPYHWVRMSTPQNPRFWRTVL